MLSHLVCLMKFMLAECPSSYLSPRVANKEGTHSYTLLMFWRHSHTATLCAQASLPVVIEASDVRLQCKQPRRLR